jgi:hypothetical protein
VTEDEWEQTPPGQAIIGFVKFMFSSIMVVLAAESGQWAPALLGWLAPRRLDARGKKYWNLYFDRAHQAGLRKGLALVGCWSALETCAEDFTKAIMETNPAALDQKTIGSKTLQVSDFGSEEDRDEAYKAIATRLNRKLPGVGRYEQLFALMNLPADVPVPDIVKSTVAESQAVRNVWAHNAGHADAKFIEQARGLGFQVGQLVDIDWQKATTHISALMTYGMIVANRHRKGFGIGPMPMEGNPADTPIGRAYVAMYPDDM